MVKTSTRKVMFTQVAVEWDAKLPMNRRFTIKRKILNEFSKKGIKLEKGMIVTLFVDGKFVKNTRIGQENRIHTPEPISNKKQTLRIVVERPR